MTSKLFDKIGQFTTIPNTVIRMLPDIGLNAFAVFVCLRYHSNEDGISFPAYPLIKQETTLSRNRIARAVRTLEKAGLLTRKKRFGCSTVYILHMPPVVPFQDFSSPVSGLSVVPFQDANYTQLTRPIELETKDNNKRPNIFRLYEQNIGTLTALIAPKLEDAEKEYPADWIDWAFGVAVDQNKRNWAYVEACLKNRKAGIEPPRRNGGYKPAGTAVEEIPVYHSGDV